MFKQKNFRLLLSFCVLALVVCVPKAVLATGNQLQMSLSFYKNSEEHFDNIEDKMYDLDALQDGDVLVDFDATEFDNYNIQGRIVYRKNSNTFEFQSINNETSDLELSLLMYAVTSKDMNFYFEGENRIRGSLYFIAEPVKDTKATLTAPDLRISSRYLPFNIDLIGEPWQILHSKIQMNGKEAALVNEAPLEIDHSTIDIDCEPPAELEYSGSRVMCIQTMKPMEVSDSTISIKGIADYVYGLYARDKLVFTDSKLTIDTEGKQESNALFAGSNYTEIAADFVNSEVYLNATLSSDAAERAEAYAIDGDSYYEFGTPYRYIHVSNSVLETQGDSGAIKAPVVFKETLHDAYVKKNLNDEITPYPVNNKDDKKNLGGDHYTDPKYKFVRIEPHLKSFVIDADAQPVDQRIYEFVRWEAKGFIIDEPDKKRTTVKIPIVWSKDASIRGIWKKNDTTNDGQPNVIIKTVPMAFSNVQTKTIYKTPLTDMPYLLGYPDKTIRPEGHMTRAEAVATVVRLERIKGKDGRSLNESDKRIYPDVKDGAWHKKYIDYAYDQGWLNAKVGEAFYPDRPITRAELAQLICHIDKKNSAVAPFKDVKGHKYEAAINQAYGNGRIKGYEDNSFRPEGQIKRSEVAAMLNRLYDRRPDKAFIDKHNDIITNFKDLNRNHWAYYDLVDAFEAHEYVKNETGDEAWIRLVDASVK